MTRQALDELKQQIPLLDYLLAHDWRAARRLSRGRWMGLCPLHGDRKPSFMVDPNKGLFYCYGCGRGGDVIRFAELYYEVRFPQALALLRQWRGLAPLLQETTAFYGMQLHRHSEAVIYLHQRGIRSPEVIEHMRIGYAPGGCLRGRLMELGHPLAALRQAGLVTAVGYDAYVRRIVFPLEGNLYGRSISPSAPPHRFLPGTKGGLYCWEQTRQVAEVILVEGLFDYASLWQAGFRNVTCAMGTHLNRHQFRQLCDRPRTVYLAFDADTNGSGQRASQSLACRLREQGLNARTVSLPDRHDPNSFFLQGARHASVPLAVGVCSVMKFRVMYQQPVAGAQSPVRIVEQTSGRALGWINRFLDREYVRRVAERTLRIDAYDLLHFVRWWESLHHTGDVAESDLTESTLLDYVRFQSSQQPRPAGSTINDRVALVDRALRNEFPNAPCQSVRGFHQPFLHRRPMGLGRPRVAMSRLRVKTPKRTSVPLSVEEVARFWFSFRLARDIALVGLMLMQGLRSAEVLALNRDDLLLSEGQLRVRGKGNKLRFLPLAPESIQLLDHYLRLERPNPCTAALFVSLKGPARGQRMTPAGIRSLFRYHRRTTGVALANPHRFPTRTELPGHRSFVRGADQLLDGGQ